MNRPRCTLTILLTALPLSAQGPITSPFGFDTTEGNSDFATFFTPRRLQQIDATVVGSAGNLQSLAFRRNGTFASTGALARTATMTVTMGHGNYATLDPIFNNNYLTPPVTVFTPKTVNIPDWTTLPTTPPAAFDLVASFDVPFAYDGVRALVWDVVVDSLTRSSDMYVDRENRSNTRTSGTSLGTGCLATGRTSTYSHFLALLSYAPGDPLYSLRIEHSGSNAPANAAVALVMGVVDPDLPVPGLCANARVVPLIDLARTPASASGFLSTQYIDLPLDPAWVGTTIYSQYASPDGGQGGLPLAVSNGRATVLPAPPAQMRCAYHFASPTTASATVFAGMGVIVQLGR